MTDDKPPLPTGTSNLPAAGDGQTTTTNHPPSKSADGPKPIPAGAISAEPFNVPPIPLNPQAAKPTTTTTTTPAKKDLEPKDSFRELIETIVFVVVLVLMLKTFLAEAFVIPTGSMADTLLGYHYKITCKQCGYPNLVNASFEADPQDRRQSDPVVSCQCQNCGFTNVLRRFDPKEGQP